jgi:hypothetical protein
MLDSMFIEMNAVHENGQDDSSGHQVLEEELRKLQQKKHDGSQSGLSDKHGRCSNVRSYGQ